MAISIRLATPADAVDMAQVHMRSWADAYQCILPAAFIREKNATRPALYQQVITGDNTDSYVIESDGKIVGIMGVGAPHDDDADDDVYELLYLYLHPDTFRMGIGSQAMAFAFNLARSLGKSTMTLWVLAENVNALAFYEKCGFLADGKTNDDAFGIAMRSIRMRREL